MLRHLVALALLLSFGLFTAEELVADVHDGDATHEELVRIDGDQHADRHASSAADADELPGERAPGETGHAQHACHCVHAHGAWSPVLTVLATSISLVESDHPAVEPHGALSPALEPQLRPPIA